MKIMLGALDLLKSPATLSSLEIKRCRTIVSLSRAYMNTLEVYDKYTSLEQRIVDMEARLLDICRHNLQFEKDPAEKARLEQEINQLEESLRQSSKYYKPFRKKPSLVTPF